MSKSEKAKDLVSPSLTWKEQNPFFYRFNSKVITRLEKVTKQARKDNGINHKNEHHTKEF